MSYHMLRLLYEQDGEFPDATVTEEQKRSMRFLVGICEVSRSSHELAYLAGAFENAAKRKRAEEQSSARRRHPRANNPPDAALSKYEFRADGWPLCPRCGEDELWSMPLARGEAYFDGKEERPRVALAGRFSCYLCGWAGRVSPGAETV